ncbi:MAG: diguanylate cyclase [Desulfobacteraceae bacterium]|nr:diguanylate cyclase [Desulfobacteraceae bacterium]
MFRLPAVRLSIVLTILTVNLLFMADMIGLVPNQSETILNARKSLSESLAIQFSSAAERGDLYSIQSILRFVSERHESIRSAAVRTNTGDGKLIAYAGEHLKHWKKFPGDKSTPTHIQVPVYRKGAKWATVEIRFAPIWSEGLAGGFLQSFTGLLLFIGLTGFICTFFILKRSFRELDPSRAIPERVQKAFDVLQEGVLFLNDNGQIVMANKSLANLLNTVPSAIIGVKASGLGWLNVQTGQQTGKLPWDSILSDGLEKKNASLSMKNHLDHKIKLAVNAAKIGDHHGNCCGCIVTFDDITQLEEKNFELNDLVEKLEQSHEEIQVKSQELKFLANRDPLTLCLNRRAFGIKLDKAFEKSKTDKTPLSCLMVDIDHFKSVNDRYGHATGDEVIKKVAMTLKTVTSEKNFVSRYGGEEFCIVLPDENSAQAAKIAEQIRKTIESEPCSGVNVTVSIGVSCLENNPAGPDVLVNQADKALYVAKEGGRNQVIEWAKTKDVLEKDSDTDKALMDQAFALNNKTCGAMDQAQLQKRVKELEGLLAKGRLELDHYKMYDIKTGLPTRNLLEDRIAREISRSKRNDTLTIVLSISIDTIKRIEETLGHRAANQLLKACANRLNDYLREDIDTVAVVSGVDEGSAVSLMRECEFGILLTDIKQSDNVTWVTKRLLEAFYQPFQVKDQQVYLSAFAGVGMYPHDGETAEELYNSAVTACRLAKKQNCSSRYLFSSKNINDRSVKHILMENCLRSAIKQNEMHLVYQPLVKPVSGKVSGFEVFLRWQSEKLGKVPPEQFLPIAENSGQINEIGEWVLQEACLQLKQWLIAGLPVDFVSVNISGMQLQKQNLTDRISAILRKFNLKPNQLEIELTETALMDCLDKSLKVLHQISGMGTRISLDDFGTGYSSLTYLRTIPLSRLKIDSTFIKDIGKDKNAEKLIASIISMSHGLGLEVAAEGVEKQFQADFLKNLKCDFLQGNYFGHPVSAGQAMNYLKAEHTSDLPVDTEVAL